MTKSEPYNFDDSVAAIAEWGSSPGYPHVLKYVSKIKFFEEQKEQLLRDFLSDRTNGFHSSILKGDETLKAGKRIRELAAVEFPIMLKQAAYCHRFNKFLSKYHEHLPIKLGISTENGGWQHIVNLKSHCSFGLSQDATGHDTTIPPELIYAVRDIRRHFLNLNEREKNIFHALYDNVICKNIVDLDGFVFVTQGGVPSGYFCTSEDNSLLSWLMVIIFFITMYGDRWQSEYHKYVLFVYGDDVWFGFKRDAPGLPFNVNELHSYYLSKNYVIKAEKWVDPWIADFLSNIEIPFRGGFVNVMQRHVKVLETMDVFEKEHINNKLTRLQRLISMRDKVAGTSSFQAAEEKVKLFYQRLPQRFKDEIVSNVFSSRRNELAILDKRFGTMQEQCSSSGQLLNFESHFKFRLASAMSEKIVKKTVKKIFNKKKKPIKASHRNFKPKRSFVRVLRNPRARMLRQAPVATAYEHPHSSFSIRAARDGGSVRIIGSEPVKTIMSSAGFYMALDEYINPLNADLFTRLSAEAAVYEKYRFHKVELRFVPLCPTSTPGSVGLLCLTDSEPSESASSFTAMLRYQYSKQVSAWSPCSQAVDGKALHSEDWYYTTSNAAQDNSTLGTLRTANQGVLQVYTAGGPDNTVIWGTLHVYYDCELKQRRVSNSAAIGGTTQSVTLTGSSSITTPTFVKLTQDAINNFVGSAGNIISSDNDELRPYNQQTASYVTLLGIGVATLTNCFGLRRGALQLFGRLNFGAIASSESKEDYFVVEEKKKGDKQLVKRNESTTPFAFEIKQDDSLWVQENFGDPWIPYSESKVGKLGVHSPAVVYDVTQAWYLYDSVTNTTNYLGNVTVNQTTAGTLNLMPISMSNNSNYSKYIFPFISLGLAASTTRAYTIDVTASANGSPL